jgi:putative peptidoglycan lipid II flippase
VSPRPNRLAGAAVLIGGLTVLARLAGFGRTAVFSQTVHNGCVGQVYFTANLIPNIVFEIVAGGALASMVVPVLAGAVERDQRADVSRTASAMLTWVVLVLTPLTVLTAVFARPIMSLLTQGHNGTVGGCPRGDMVRVGADMLAVFAPQIVLYGLAVVLYGVLQSHRRFTGPALAPLLSSLVVIAAYLAYVSVAPGAPMNLDVLSRLSTAAELTLSIGTTLGVVALVLTALAFAVPVRLRLRPTLTFPDGVARRIARLAVAGLATVVAQQLASLTVLLLTNNTDITPSALVDYNYAWAVYLLPWAILAVPIATSAFPVVSARMAEGDAESFDRVTAATTRAVLLASGAGTALLAAVAQPVAHFFDRGGDPQVLARALLCFAPGLLGYGLVAHLGRVLFACGQGRASAGATVAGWLVVIVADVVLVLALPVRWRVAAFGLGNTAGMTVAGILLLAALLRVRGRAVLAGLGRAGAATVAGAVAAAAAGYAAAAALGTGAQVRNVSVAGAAALAAAVVYAAVTFAIDGHDLRAVLTRKAARS